MKMLADDAKFVVRNCNAAAVTACNDHKGQPQLITRACDGLYN